MISSFVEAYDFLKMKEKIQNYKKQHIKYKERFPSVYEITEEYYEQFKCNQITYYSQLQRYLRLRTVSESEGFTNSETLPMNIFLILEK